MRSLPRQTVMQKASIALAATLFVAALGYSVYYHWVVEVLPIDDAFIHYRYVHNLLAGDGPVYNVGERVMGSSSPLYVLWLGLLKITSGGTDLPALAVHTNALWHVLTMICMAGILKRIAGSWPLSLMFASVAALAPEMLSISSGGMESFLWCALVLGAIWAQAEGRSRLSAALAGFSVLARPEGLLVLGLWGLVWLCARPRRAAVALAWLVSPLALWLITATAYYGTPVPQSLLSKSAGLYPMPWSYVPQELAKYALRWSWGDARAASDWLGTASAVGVLGLASLGLIVSLELRRRGIWALIALLCGLGAFYTAGHTLMVEWYRPLLWCLWFPAVFGGLAALAGFLAHVRQERRATIARWGSLAVALLCATVLALGPGRSIVRSNIRDGLLRPTVSSPARARVLAYLDAAHWLNAHAPAGAKVAAPEIGALGYHYRGYIYDACGLISPQALPYLPVPANERLNPSTGAIGTAFVRAMQPDYVATMQVFAAKSLAVDPWFQANYRLVSESPLPKPLWSSTSVLVYERANLPSAP